MRARAAAGARARLVVVGAVEPGPVRVVVAAAGGNREAGLKATRARAYKRGARIHMQTQTQTQTQTHHRHSHSHTDTQT